MPAHFYHFIHHARILWANTNVQWSIGGIQIHPVKPTVSRYPHHHLAHIFVPHQKIYCSPLPITYWATAGANFT